MIDDYFENLLYLHITLSSMTNLINDYNKINDSNITPIQVLILHHIKKMKGNISPRDLGPIFEKISSNNDYSFKSLIKNGYIVSRTGKELGIDNRLVKLILTEEGIIFYKELCNFIIQRLKNGKKDFEFDKEIFVNFLKQLSLIRNNINE